jgi:hypothetical protein
VCAAVQGNRAFSGSVRPRPMPCRPLSIHGYSLCFLPVSPACGTRPRSLSRLLLALWIEARLKRASRQPGCPEPLRGAAKIVGQPSAVIRGPDLVLLW